MAERTPQMSVEEFETIASAAPETVTLDCVRSRPDLYRGMGLRVEAHREGRAKPDAVLAPEAHFAGQGERADPDGALMVVEVTSYDSDSDADIHRRNRHELPAA